MIEYVVLDSSRLHKIYSYEVIEKVSLPDLLQLIDTLLSLTPLIKQ